MTHATTTTIKSNRLGERPRCGQRVLPAALRDLLGRVVDAPEVEDEVLFGDRLTALRPRLRRYAQSLTRDHDRADDLVQDTMLRAWAARGRFEKGTNLRAWTYTILRNLFKSAHRRSRFVGEYDEMVAEHRLAGEGNQIATVELAEVTRAIGQLAANQREALMLVAVDGLSYEEAAARTSTPLGTLKSRVSRARMAIQAMLDSDLTLLGAEPTEAVESITATVPAPLKATRSAWAIAKASERTLWIG